MLDHRYYIWDNKAFQSFQTEQQNKPPAAEFKNLELHRMSILGVVFGTSSRLTRPACATFSSVCFSFLCVFRCSLYTHDTSAPDSLQTCWHVGCCNFMEKQKTHSSSCKLKAVHWQKGKKKFLLFSQVHDNFAATDFFVWHNWLFVVASTCHHRCRISILFNLAPAVVLLWSSKKLALKPNALYVQSKNRLNTPANISDFSARNSPDHHLHFLHL